MGKTTISVRKLILKKSELRKLVSEYNELLHTRQKQKTVDSKTTRKIRMISQRYFHETGTSIDSLNKDTE